MKYISVTFCSVPFSFNRLAGPKKISKFLLHTYEAPKFRHLRCRNRDARGIEEVGCGKRVSLPLLGVGPGEGLLPKNLGILHLKWRNLVLSGWHFCQHTPPPRRLRARVIIIIIIITIAIVI